MKTVPVALSALLIAAAVPGGARAQTRPVGVAPTEAPAKGRIATKNRIAAAAVSGYLGFGVGHYVVGFGEEGEIFRWTQVGSLLTGSVALASGVAGCWDDEGCGSTSISEVVFYTSAAVFIGSRIWELGDVIIRPTLHNSRIKAAQSAEPGIDPVYSVTPIIGSKGQGLMLSIRF
jgi:hypothetical protein